MTGCIEAQKQCVIKKIVTMHSIFLHVLEMYSMQQLETLNFQKPRFPIDFYRMITYHFVFILDFKCKFKYDLSHIIHMKCKVL